jgi:SAM-dependent methyltransferase
MDHACCPVCGHDDAVPHILARDLQYLLPGEFPVVRCLGCGLIYVSPQPSAEVIAGHYPPRYFETYASSVERLVAEGRAREDGYFQRLGRLDGFRHLQMRKERAVLDVGCGCGLFLLNMASTGWQTAGLEPSAQAVGFATGRLGLERIRHGDVSTGTFSNEEFDLVTMWHVLEHVHDPLDTLRRVRSWLRVDGLMAICVPNIGSLQARLFGRFWFHLDAPRHLVHYSPVTLEALLTKAGFQICEREDGCDNTTGWDHSLRRLAFAGLRSLFRRPSDRDAVIPLEPVGSCLGGAAPGDGPRRVASGSAYAAAYTAFHRGLAAIVRPPARLLGLMEGALGQQSELLVLARRAS